uniref:hypothetical protein n=1 Tax=Stomatohabitans albus TaxID=3110766 RepID=UPI00300CE76E
MANRTSRSNTTVTLTYGGKQYADFVSHEKGEHVLNTGRYSAAGAKGDIVTVSQTRAGGSHTLKKRFDLDEFRELKAVTNPECAFTEIVLDHNGQVVGTAESFTGVVVSIASEGTEAGSGDPKFMMIKIEADGEVQ